ncbi:non-homologous end-joining DNA ligase [Streptomyces sp. DSM 44917]|uniref:Non-homologous end-joining DNA ligase n=1 Tax=Streptomyces boetiae TaxID=3075541 RepID=A0ABU2L4Z1_9ACTN|nr:non-homologous end-joining DNA ligase [Streptomyces sp. DSM 44917]MDT0306600.1 non-homologous end-joining DNA ligase [Streptomyces sp. DSM 44917]
MSSAQGTRTQGKRGAAGRRPEVRVSGRSVPLSNPGKEMFPEDDITKAELVDYYRAVARPMLAHLRGRPVAMERYPDGYRGRSFYHKAVPAHFPGWVHRETVPKQGGTVEMAVCDDAATLAYLANQACLTPHAWLSRAGHLGCPDRMVLDLDPPSATDDGDPFELVRWAAGECAGLLTGLGLHPAAMTTGSRGVHVVVPLDGGADFDEVRDFARRAAGLLARRHPGRLTTEIRKNRRGARLYLDVQRNAYAQTAVAPYAVRARPHAPVATPLRWEELTEEGVGPRDFTLRTVPGRLAEHGDPWSGLHRKRRSLRAARGRLDALEREEGR